VKNTNSEFFDYPLEESRTKFFGRFGTEDEALENLVSAVEQRGYEVITADTYGSKMVVTYMNKGIEHTVSNTFEIR
jgi:hypothetical protein